MGKRILIKLSGETLSGSDGKGIDFNSVLKVCNEIKKCKDLGNEIAIVVGGGNFWRGRNHKDMDSCVSSHIGMLGTTMNALTLQEGFKQCGVESRVQTGIEMLQIAEFYIKNRAVRHLEKGRIVIFGCGTGNPFFSTDTAAALNRTQEKGRTRVRPFDMRLDSPPALHRFCWGCSRRRRAARRDIPA